MKSVEPRFSFWVVRDKRYTEHYGLTYIFVPYVIFNIDWVRPEDDAVKRSYGSLW